MYIEDFNILEQYDVLAEETNEGRKAFKIRGVFSKCDVPNKNKRVYRRPIMEQAIEEVRQFINKGGFVGELDHPCLTSNDFDVLTEEGWKPFTEITKGFKVLSFDDNNNIITNEVSDIIDESYKGKAYHFKGRSIDSTFTGAHRFYLEDRYGRKVIATAKEIYEDRAKYNKHKIIKVRSWVADSPEKLQIGEKVVDAKAFLAFIGFYLAEGYSSKKPNLIGICQNEGMVADEFRDILAKLPFEVKERSKKRKNSVAVEFQIRDKDLYDYLKPLGSCYEKHIPYELKQLDAPYLEELIEWFIKGDGRDQRHFEGSNRRNLFSVSKRLIEDLHELVIKIGGSGNWTEQETTENYWFADHLIEAENKKTLYQLNISTTKGIYLDERFLSIEEVDHDGKIYCLTVPSGNFYMKQNGKAFLTGNSTPKVNMDKISHKITKLAIAEDGSVVGEMVPAGPKKNDLISLLEDGIRIGVSTRGTGAVKPYDGPLGEGLVDVQPGYKLRAIDIVFDPSAGAFPETVMEGTEYERKEYLYIPSNFKAIWNDVFGK